MLPGFEKIYKNLPEIKFIQKKTDKHKQYKQIKIKNS